ncbi:MAG: DNA polymerase I [Saprospiraceae bacterium]
MEDKKLYLLDGHALVYRAHFAFIARPLINSKGLNTSAINGFTRTLWDLIQKEKPSHIAVAFDPSGPTFRHEQYSLYKANREEQPDDIKKAFPYIKQIVEAFNIPIVTVNNYEADDVIGTLAKQAEKEGYKVYMVTPDKDYAQLVSPNIFMYKPSRQGNGIEILGEEEILRNWGITRVDQVIDILGMQGDAVDNIPGIPGIGPKTAVKLLEEFDTVENLISQSKQLKGKQKERVEEFADQALLSKKLATIDCNVPIQFDATTFVIDPPNRALLAEIFKELEFRSLAQSILGQSENSSSNIGVQSSLFDAEKSEVKLEDHAIATHTIDHTEHRYYLVDKDEEINVLIDRLSKTSIFAFDSETTGLDANLARLVGMSFSIEKGEGFYVPVPQSQEQAEKLVDRFRAVFEDETIEKIAQNFKYDALILKHYGVEVKGLIWDTMLLHYLLEPDLRHNMDYLSETYLKYKPISITTLIGEKGKNQLKMTDVPIEKVVDYAAEDADITGQLFQHFIPKIKESGLEQLYMEVEEPLAKVLVDMEYEGINLNSDLLSEYAVILKNKIGQVEANIYEMAGKKFNISSPKQVGEILFIDLNIPYRWRKTKSGQYSTNEEKLSELAGDYPIIKEILNHRGMTKLLSTYVEALPKMVNPKTKRIHTSFNQALAATGRLSSYNPNLQNIPIRTPEGAKVREAFIPRDKNHVLLAADYSQIELRLIAEISGDRSMLEAFQSGKDIHSTTAANVFEVPYDQVTKEQRYRAKTVNFSIIYGAGATNLSRQLNIKRSEANELIQQYFKQYKGIQAYMENTISLARNQGYVTTLLGRRRYLRDINSKSSLEKSNAERMAINSPIQGSAADLIKLAMINIGRAIKESQLKSKMILQVHDELIFDVPLEELEEMKTLVKREMENAMPSLSVPVLVEVGVGNNWREAH